jgi:glucokinase
MTGARHTVGVDVGGTKVLAGLVGADGQVLATERVPTPGTTADEVAGAIGHAVRLVLEKDLPAGDTVEAIGVGAAGWISADRATVLYSPNVAWRGEPLRDRLESSLDLPVVIENDANAAAWAEHRFGAARGAESTAVVTVGTGIGGGLVIGDRLHRGAFGVAGEFGHIKAVPNGRLCGCAGHGCLEQYASGRALVRAAREGATSRPAEAEVLLRLAGGAVADIEGVAVTAAARLGDPVACAAFNEVGQWLGRGVADLIMVWDPACVVIGGGVVEAGELLLEPTRKALRTVLGARATLPLPPIRPASLLNLAGLIGAADLARTR